MKKKDFATLKAAEKAAYVAELEAENEMLAEANKAAADEIVKLSEEIGKVKKVANVLPTVKLADGTYQFIMSKFTIQYASGSMLPITAEEAKKDKELCERLVKEGFGGLVKIEKEK